MSRSRVEKRNKGTTPSTAATNSERTRVKMIARALTPISLTRGRLVRFKLSKRSTPQKERSTPIPPPVSARSRFSVTSCRARRQRVAPRAVRTANSLCLAVVWASNKFATFAHATINKNPTANKIIVSGRRTFPTMYSCCGTRVKSAASTSLPYSCLSCLLIALSSAAAVSIGTSGRSRATTLQLCADRDVSPGNSSRGIQISVA